jgi:hypothetical protein
MRALAIVLLAVLVAQCFASEAKTRHHLRDLVKDSESKAAATVKANVAVEAGAKKQDPATALTSSSCAAAPCTVMGDQTGYDDGTNSLDNPPPPGDILEALRPIEDWISVMKKRVGAGGDLYNAAEATVRPLIDKLKRVQKATEEKIEQSNDAIIQHVEEATTNHIYNLLRATHEMEKQEQTKEETSEQQKEFDREEKERKALQQALVKGAGAADSSASSS